MVAHAGSGTDGRKGRTASPDAAGGIGELGRELSRWLGTGALPPEAEGPLRSPGGLSGLQAATVAAQEGRIAELLAQVAALTAQVARLERDLYGPRSERHGKGSDAPSGQDGQDSDGSRRGGRPGRRKERGDSVGDAGLRFSGKAPVPGITVTPPEVDGLPEDGYEVVSERVHCRLAAVEFRHVVIRYRYLTVKVRGSDRPVSAPAREGVSRSSCADVSLLAGMPVDRFMWHLPPSRQHRMLAEAGITVSRGSLSQWANRAIALLEPVHEAQWRSVLESAVIQMDETPIRAGRHPGRPGSMRKGYLWPVLGDRGEVVFPFSDSRKHGNAVRFLDACSGTLVTDGHRDCEAYVAARGGAVTHQTCWVHARRGFEELKDTYPEMAGEALDLIGAIYRIEREIRDRTPAGRLAARRTRSRAAVAAFRDWCDRTLEDPALTPRHPVRRAITYATERWAALGTFPGTPTCHRTRTSWRTRCVL